VLSGQQEGHVTADPANGFISSRAVFPVRPNVTVVANYVILAFLTVIVPALFVWGWLHPESATQVPSFLIPPWLLIMAWSWFVLLSRPYVIEIHENRTIAFVSVLGRRVVHATDILAVRPALWGQGEAIVRHTGGRIRLLHDYDRFDEFLRQLTALNPRVETSGKELMPFP
jgi:hypothetical protein